MPGRVCAALGEVEEKLATLSEDPAQEAGHGEDEMAMRDGREDLVLQPLGPQKLLLLLARRAEVPAAARERAKHARPASRAPKPGEAMFDEPTAHEAAQHALDHGTQRAALANLSGYTRRNSSRCRSTSRNRGDSRARLGL
jgi:hypothetical protein